MPFTQEKRYNIKHCDGCPEHCALGVHTSSYNGMLFPTIAGQTISSYKNRSGQTVHLNQSDISYLGGKRNIAKVLDTAYKIARLCDNYNAKTK